MSYRTAQVYVQVSTMKRLRLVAHIYQQSTTLDEMIDRLLNEKIDEQYPLVRELEAKLNETEKAFIKAQQQKEQSNDK